MGSALSTVWKRGQIGIVDALHLLDGKGETVRDFCDVVDLVQTKGAALSRFQIFVEHLIAADAELPDLLRHGREILRGINPDGPLKRRIARLSTI